MRQRAHKTTLVGSEMYVVGRRKNVRGSVDRATQTGFAKKILLGPETNACGSAGMEKKRLRQLRFPPNPGAFSEEGQQYRQHVQQIGTGAVHHTSQMGQHWGCPSRDC
jgi:hypothetical protein